MIHSRMTLLGVTIAATIALVLTNLTAQPAAAPTAAGTRVAVCDVAQVFNNYQRVKEEEAKFDAIRRQVQAEKDKREKDLKQLNDELGSLDPGSPKFQATLNTATKRAIELRAWLEYQDTVAARDHHALTEAMYGEVMNMIAQVAKARGIQLVVYREGDPPKTKSTAELLRVIRSKKVLYVDDRIDITDETVGQLNAAYNRRRAPAGG